MGFSDPKTLLLGSISGDCFTFRKNKTQIVQNAKIPKHGQRPADIHVETWIWTQNPNKTRKNHLKKHVKIRAFRVKKIQGIFEGVYLVLQLIPRRMVKVRPLKKLCGRQGGGSKTLAFFEKGRHSGCVSNLST